MNFSPPVVLPDVGDVAGSREEIVPVLVERDLGGVKLGRVKFLVKNGKLLVLLCTTDPGCTSNIALSNTHPTPHAHAPPPPNPPPLIKPYRHHAVRQVEGLLHAVAVVDVDVDVQNPIGQYGFDWGGTVFRGGAVDLSRGCKVSREAASRRSAVGRLSVSARPPLSPQLHGPHPFSPRVALEQLQDGQHQIVHVAEPAGLGGWGVGVSEERMGWGWGEGGSVWGRSNDGMRG
jgi:hypothetical protein